MRKIEASGLCTSMVQNGNQERFALVMESSVLNLRLYFFVTRDMVHEIVQSMVEMVGYDA